MLQSPQNDAGLDAKADVWALAITWSHLHQIAVPFSFCDADCLRDTFACLDAYDSFLQQVITLQGDVDTARILAGPGASDVDPQASESPHQPLIDGFYRWAKAGLEVDQEVFVYLLEGPLQASPKLRPHMAEVADFLRGRMDPPKVRFYMEITKRLSQAARYRLPDKRGTDTFASRRFSEKRFFTVAQIKSDLQLFSESSGASEDALVRASVQRESSLQGAAFGEGHQGITAPS